MAIRDYQRSECCIDKPAVSSLPILGLVDGMFFPTYLQGITLMQQIAEPRPGITERVVINPFQLDAALALDAMLDSMACPDSEYAPIGAVAQETNFRDKVPTSRYGRGRTKAKG